MAYVPFNGVDAGGEDKGKGLVTFKEIGICVADGVVADRVAARVD